MQRRHFLRNTGICSLALPLRLQGFGLQAASHTLSPGLLQAPAALENRILVIINLLGGNDGLNTVIPINQYSQYQSLRPNLAIPSGQVLPLQGVEGIGLHPALSGLRNLYNEGLVSIIHAAGYPSPNQSHARSADIWMSAVDANQYASTGWAGRYLQERFTGYPQGYPNPAMQDPPALQIGYTATPTLQGTTTSTGITINNADDFYRLIGESNQSAGEHLPCCDAGDLIQFVRQQQLLAVGYSGQIKKAADAGKNLQAYPANNELAAQLKIVARLIHGGLQSKIYFVSQDGYDTHGNQAEGGSPQTGFHANLLKNLGDAVHAFYNDLQLLGLQNRVLSMTFSEFGRRANSNLSMGTDHGYAAPMFVIGPGLTKQQIGMPPSLTTDLLPTNPQPWETQREIAMQIDFRRIYADILNDWLGNDPASTNQLLYKPFGTTSLLKPTIETAQTGQWAQRSTWSAGRPPLPMETVVVNPGHILELTQDAAIYRIDVQGELRVKPGVNLKVTGQ